MMMLLAALLVASDPAVAAAQPAAAAPVASPAAKPEKPKKICKKLDGDTGTHMSRRVCKTEDEWAIYNQGQSADDLNARGGNVH